MLHWFFTISYIMMAFISGEPSFRSDLRVAGVNFINKNKTVPTQSSTSTLTSTISINKQNGAVKSEIYKMHNNGLMLLHPQRPKSGNDAKKSSLINSPAQTSSINYHVRKRVKENSNETGESTVAENEHYLESKLGDLPQIERARELNSTEEYLSKLNSAKHSSEKQADLSIVKADITSKLKTSNSKINKYVTIVNPQEIAINKSQQNSNNIDKRLSLQSPKDLKNTAQVGKNNISELSKHFEENRNLTKADECKDCKREIGSNWASQIQGEDYNGGEIMRSSIYPRHTGIREEDRERQLDDIKLEKQQIIYKKNNKYQTISEGSKKYKLLTRVFRSMSDNPLFDEDQPEETLKRYHNKRQLRKMKQKLGKLFDRGITDIPAIPPIPNINSRIEKLEPLENVPRFADFKPAVDNWPRFGVPELTMMHYPRFARPKMDDFELIPGIPRIKPLSRGDEVTGDKRGFPVKNEDEFYDEELDDEVVHATAPTDIPSITDIPSLTDIPDIPTVKPAPNRFGGHAVQGKMPVMETVETEEGKETRISA